MKLSLIIGMGIGQLYKTVLEDLGHKVVTVDLHPGKADYTDLDKAVEDHKGFDTVHICTPNFTHAEIARKLAPVSRIVFIEKPGVKNAKEWQSLVGDFPNTRFMMVKNNQWRDNIELMKELATSSASVYIDWMNKDRVPNPGTWFTTKELAYGGVSRDLMPHLLSLFIALTPDYMRAHEVVNVTKQAWKLEDLTQTDYGTVKADGIYDVDDYCRIEFLEENCNWHLTANWRTMDEDQRQIEFHLLDGTVEVIELGLCPEEAYRSMIKEAVENVDNHAFWLNQFLQDIWIHNKI
jgi:predicted dehydrogenase